MNISKETLAKLSHAEKLELLEMLEKKEEAALDNTAAYKPNAKQQAVITSQKLERYLFCGNGFGKTALLVNEIHWAATGYNPITKLSSAVPAKIALMLDSPEKIEDILGEYRKWHSLSSEQLSKRGRANYSHITFKNGSAITVFSHDVNPLKLEGSEWTHIFFDEPPPRPCFISLVRGGRIKGRPLKVLLAGTPITAAWMRREIYEPWSKGSLPDVECFKGSMKDNIENLAEGSISKFSARLSEKEKRIRIEGEFFDLDGLALAHLLDRSVHIVPRERFNYNTQYPCVVAIDPHPSKDHVAILLTVDDHGQMYYVKELTMKATARDFAYQLKRWYQGFKVADIVCDSLGSAEMTGGEGFKSFIQILNENGVRARATSWDEKQDEAFINRIQDALTIPLVEDNDGRKIPKLRILSGNNGILSNIEFVCWTKHRGTDEFKPKLDISNQDYLACLKYALATNLAVTKGKTEPLYINKPVYGVNLKPVMMKWSRR